MLYWIALALFLLSIMETVSHHFERSIFSQIKNKFLYDFFKSDWRRKYTETLKKKKGLEYIIALIDAYHVCKWGMILSFALAFNVVWYVPIFAVMEWIIHRLFYTEIFLKLRIMWKK